MLSDEGESSSAGIDDDGGGDKLSKLLPSLVGLVGVLGSGTVSTCGVLFKGSEALEIFLECLFD